MKNGYTRIKYVLLSLVVVFLVSCAGDDGSQGPAGPQGPAGQDGNADVFASDWYRPLSYTLSTGFGGIKLLEYDQAAVEITQGIVDTGVVLVYGKLNGYTSSVWPTDQVGLLTITLTYSSAPVDIDTWSAIISEGNIKIRFINNNNTYSSLNTTNEFRYVVIPSGNTGSARGASDSYQTVVAELASAGVDVNNYLEVLDYYGK